MVNIDKAFEVRYKKDKQTFEVLVDFQKLQEFKENKTELSIYDVLADFNIYKDQRTGKLASEKELAKLFSELSKEEILKKILMEGECQIPTSYLNDLRQKKKEQVITFISNNAINPQMNSKYSYSMIEREIDKLHYNFDHSKDSEKQAYEILKMLKKKFPISISEVIIEIKIPSIYASSFYGNFRSLGQIKKEFYDTKGDLNLQMKVTEGTLDKVISFIKQKTHSEAEYFIKKN